MAVRPRSVKVALFLIILNAVIWLIFSAIVVLDGHPALPDSPLVKWVMAALAFATAIALFGLSILLKKRIRIAYYLALAFLLFISILTIFDDFGLVDLVVLMINIIPIILLIKDRVWYRQPKSHTDETG